MVCFVIMSSNSNDYDDGWRDGWRGATVGWLGGCWGAAAGRLVGSTDQGFCCLRLVGLYLVRSRQRTATVGNMARPMTTALAVAAAVAVTASSSPASPVPRAQTKPHLLFLMADQLRWNTNGYAGGQANLTPALDRLASEGVELQYSWSATPTCTPARAALLTGQTPWNHGMLGYGSVAERYPVEMPRTIAGAGYATVSLGKDHFGWNDTANHGVDHGYQNTTLYDGLGSWEPRSVRSGWWAGQLVVVGWRVMDGWWVACGAAFTLAGQ
jgi:hypothetical protein